MKLQLFAAIVFIIDQADIVFVNQMKEQCKKIGGNNEAIKEIENSYFGEFMNCPTFAELSQDLIVASQTGNFKPLITKSCNKVPEIKQCIRPLMSATQKCLSQQKRQDLEIINALVDEALDYVCFNGGERISSFLATGGLDCYNSNANKFLECQNSSELQSMIKNIFLNESVSFFNEKSCKLSEVPYKCVLGVLKTCSDKTMNLIEGLYNATEKKTPCNVPGVRRNGAYHPESSILLTGTIIVWKIITLFEF